MNPRNVNRELAEEVAPRRYQTNARLNQPPTRAANRPVREYVTNVSWQAHQLGAAADGPVSRSTPNRPTAPAPKPSVTAAVRAIHRTTPAA
jgi:hypothetical protein